MLARGLITLLALACILAGVEGSEAKEDLSDKAIGTMIRTLELQYTQCISVVVTYMGGNETFSTSNLTLDPGKKYTLILVEMHED